VEVDPLVASVKPAGRAGTSSAPPGGINIAVLQEHVAAAEMQLRERLVAHSTAGPAGSPHVDHTALTHARAPLRSLGVAAVVADTAPCRMAADRTRPLAFLMADSAAGKSSGGGGGGDGKKRKRERVAKAEAAGQAGDAPKPTKPRRQLNGSLPQGALEPTGGCGGMGTAGDSLAGTPLSPKKKKKKKKGRGNGSSRRGCAGGGCAGGGGGSGGTGNITQHAADSLSRESWELVRTEPVDV
jgi:hypothetical protein